MSKKARIKEARAREEAIGRLLDASGRGNEKAVREEAGTMSIKDIEETTAFLREQFKDKLPVVKAIADNDYVILTPYIEPGESKLPRWQQWLCGVFGRTRLRGFRVYKWVYHYSRTQRYGWHGWARVVWLNGKATVKK